MKVLEYALTAHYKIQSRVCVKAGDLLNHT